LTALQILYSRPYAQRLRYRDVKALAEAITAPPLGLTTDALWHAYRTLEEDKVRGGGTRMLTDIVALVRYALHHDAELVPFRETVETRFAAWLAAQDAAGRPFTAEQRAWLSAIKEHIAASAEIDRADLDESPFRQMGGLGKVHDLFGAELDGLLDELNEVLAA